MTDLPIDHEERGHRGAFFLAREGHRLAEMTYSRSSETQVIVDHTEVSEELRGLGVGRKLVDALVAWARSTGTSLVVTCPYARSVFERDPSIRDVLA